jgi:hypothetical protein
MAQVDRIGMMPCRAHELADGALVQVVASVAILVGTTRPFAAGGSWGILYGMGLGTIFTSYARGRPMQSRISVAPASSDGIVLET